MSRRRYSSRPLRLESLEARCNPSTFALAADTSTEPPSVDQGALQIASLTSVAIDPFNPSAPEKPASLNGFAGQTVRIPIEAADASTASRPVGELGDDWLSGGTGQNPSNGNAPSGRLYLATDRGVFVGGAGRDVLLGGAGEDLLIGGSTQHAPGGAGLDVLIANTGGDRLDATVDALGRLLVGTDGGIWVSDDELNLLSNPQDQNEPLSGD